jgi:hypothetical protein
MDRDEWIKKKKAEREETNRRRDEAIENPVIYKYDVTIVEKYYWLKRAMVLVIAVLMPFLGATIWATASILIIYIWMVF